MQKAQPKTKSVLKKIFGSDLSNEIILLYSVISVVWVVK